MKISFALSITEIIYPIVFSVEFFPTCIKNNSSATILIEQSRGNDSLISFSFSSSSCACFFLLRCSFGARLVLVLLSSDWLSSDWPKMSCDRVGVYVGVAPNGVEHRPL